MTDTKTLAQKITDWREANPGTRITLAVVRELHGGANLYGANLSRADLYGADLYGANLSRADLYGAYLYGAYLYGADLSGADLSGADLSGANLSRADLSGANLSRADLSGANLSRAYMAGANLTGAYMAGANLYGANLSSANLTSANLTRAYLSPECGITFDAGPSGKGQLVRLDSEGKATTDPDGIWTLTIGCLRDVTLDYLRDLIADKIAWPEATGEERERRRPYLRAVLALCEAHIAYQAWESGLAAA